MRRARRELLQPVKTPRIAALRAATRQASAMPQAVNRQARKGRRILKRLLWEQRQAARELQGRDEADTREAHRQAWHAAAEIVRQEREGLRELRRQDYETSRKWRLLPVTRH